MLAFKDGNVVFVEDKAAIGVSISFFIAYK
jgi:hypothetical protein